MSCALLQFHKCSQKKLILFKLCLVSFLWSPFYSSFRSCYNWKFLIRNHTDKSLGKLKKINKLSLFLFACLLDCSYISYR